MLTNQEASKINQLHVSWTYINQERGTGFSVNEIERASNIVEVAVFVHEPNEKCNNITELCQRAAENGLMPCLVERGQTEDEKIDLLKDCYPWLIFYLDGDRMLEVTYTGDLGDNEWLELKEID